MNREQKLRCVFVILTCCVAALPASTERKRSERSSADAKRACGFQATLTVRLSTVNRHEKLSVMVLGG